LSRCDNTAAFSGGTMGAEEMLGVEPCAAVRGATRRSATSSTTSLQIRLLYGSQAGRRFEKFSQKFKKILNDSWRMVVN